jgi:hypothetical protein
MGYLQHNLIQDRYDALRRLYDGLNLKFWDTSLVNRHHGGISVSLSGIKEPLDTDNSEVGEIEKRTREIVEGTDEKTGLIAVIEKKPRPSGTVVMEVQVKHRRYTGTIIRI